MIIIALIFHKLGHYIPLWICKEKFKDLRAKFEWRLYLFEMNGVIMNFILAFLIILTITLSSKEKYLLNENAIFGIECSDFAKEIGFENGDKIISINHKKVDRFSDISRTIILENGDVEVEIQRGKMQKTIIVKNTSKLHIIKSHSELFLPKLRPDSITDLSVNYLKFNERKEGINDAFRTFSTMFIIVKSYITPSQAQKDIGLIKLDGAKDLKGYLFLLALSLVFIGLINLIPLPGLDAGNTIIALIEKARKRKFNERTLRIIRIVCSSMLVIIILALIFLN